MARSPPVQPVSQGYSDVPQISNLYSVVQVFVHVQCVVSVVDVY